MTEEKQEIKPRIKVMDSREPGDIRLKLLEVGWEQHQMDSADYWFFTHDFKKVGIERKEFNDLLSSMTTTEVDNITGHKGNKLTRQLEMALDHFDFVILMIEGNWKAASTGTVISARGMEYYTMNLLQNFLRAQQHKGVTLEITFSINHTIRRLNELYAWYQKPFHSGGGMIASIDNRIMAMPSGCRGKTGESLLNTFGSLGRLSRATIEQLQFVEGVGEKKAKDIYAHFHRGEDKEGLMPLEEQTKLF